MQLDAIGNSGILPSGAGLALPIPGAETANANGKSFGQYMMDALAEVNKAQVHAADMTAQYAAGKPMDVHQVMIATQEAGTMLNMAVQVRNKVVDAYQEVMRINV